MMTNKGILNDVKSDNLVVKIKTKRNLKFKKEK